MIFQIFLDKFLIFHNLIKLISEKKLLIQGIFFQVFLGSGMEIFLEFFGINCSNFKILLSEI